jgi:hypothetical protein
MVFAGYAQIFAPLQHYCLGSTPPHRVDLHDWIFWSSLMIGLYSGLAWPVR